MSHFLIGLLMLSNAIKTSGGLNAVAMQLAEQVEACVYVCLFTHIPLLFVVY
jgi:di/tricarboxylate transporter